MLSLIGNAPSSGSTLLADLLDATPFTAAGPELGLFATADAYRFDSPHRPVRHAGPATLYTTGVGVYRRGLPGYGLDEATIGRLRCGASDFDEFAKAFVDRYLALRGKDADGTVFEKTPQNINRLGDFLGASTSGVFVFLVRDPRYVRRSLVRRGYSTWQAIGTWLVAAAACLRHADDPRVRRLRFEDLLAAPFEQASSLIRDVSGREVSPGDLQFRYERNRYREVFESRVETWNQAATGRVGDANSGLSEADDQATAACLSWRVSNEYARLFDLAPLSLEEAMVALGYADVVHRLRSRQADSSRARAGDRAFCLRRWGAALKRGESGLRSLPAFWSPLVEGANDAA